ncbi:hypothetical protein CPSG_05086 [Coccidioides posadasii str. Silveira]|uniref:Uncharacterized protein n=1 Tax=Coccidioides posadasii (strain RMSCC 757 / Silveira) TaxID=443226 RepID=E9D656_COCPS|nr:hypothetical protein CPSG_05086 [Coccidioides posadasii str. Silveira]
MKPSFCLHASLVEISFPETHQWVLSVAAALLRRAACSGPALKSSHQRQPGAISRWPLCVFFFFLFFLFPMDAVSVLVGISSDIIHPYTFLIHACGTDRSMDIFLQVNLYFYLHF